VAEGVLENALVVHFACAAVIVVVVVVFVFVVVVVVLGIVDLGIVDIGGGFVATALLRYTDPKEVCGSRPFYDSAKDRSGRTDRDPSLQARRTCS
jgi:hypothetical protein